MKERAFSDGLRLKKSDACVGITPGRREWVGHIPAGLFGSASA